MAVKTDSKDYKLKVSTGEATEFYDLRGDTITIGRATDNNLPIKDGRSSRYHCKIECNDEGWHVVDVGSQNGTYLNGRRVRRSPFKIGDVVQVGSTKVTLERKLPADDLNDTQTMSEIRVDGNLTLDADEPLPVESLMHLQSTASAMNSELNLENLLNLVIDNAVRLTGAERGFLILVGKNEMEFRVARNFERREVSAPEFAISWSIATQVSTSGQPILCVNAADDNRFGAHESVASLGLRSVMCVPFKVKRRVLGVIYVDNRLHKGVFSRTDFRILEILADQAAVALENSRLYQEVVDQKRSLEEMNRRLNLEVEEQDSRLRAALPAGIAPLDSAGGDRRGEHKPLIGESAAMREVKTLIEKVARSDLPVLITGESGTGKEVVACAIHQQSERRKRRMVSENCCAIPETLLESELFGYKKGAFTGANADREGLFVAASKGTLFLDEIGDMGSSLQTKLLRVLQEGEVRPLGAKAPVKIDVRLISSTNRNLKEAIEEGSFREDLFYRIKVVSIAIPPLRERKEDIPILVDHFLGMFASEAGLPKRSITKEAIELLKSYNWPGNVRELQNELRSMAALGSECLDKVDIPSHIQEQVELLVGEESGFHDLNELVESIESREINKALRRVRGNKTKAAKLLGISRFALQRKMDKYVIGGKGEAES